MARRWLPARLLGEQTANRKQKAESKDRNTYSSQSGLSSETPSHRYRGTWIAQFASPARTRYRRGSFLNGIGNAPSITTCRTGNWKTLGIGIVPFFLAPALAVGCVYPIAWSTDHVWAPGSQLTVYLDTSFDSPHVQSIKQAFRNWQTYQPDRVAVSFTFISGNVPDGMNTYNIYNKLPSVTIQASLEALQVAIPQAIGGLTLIHI